MTKMKFLLVAILLTLISLMGGKFYIDHSLATPIALQESRLFEINKGESAYSVFKRLRSESLIDNTLTLRVASRFSSELTNLKAGVYKLVTGITIKQTIAIFSEGREAQFAVALIEGLTLEDWVKELNSSEYLLPITESDRTILKELATKYEVLTAEGLFLPDTYSYTAHSRALDILLRAHEDMTDFLQKEWQIRDKTIPLNTPYEALVLASIIEKETGVASERPRISGVFTNRLNRKMRLQTDPTVIYGMGDRFDGDIRKRDLRERTPYNTYVINGLPPTPIAMASKAAIVAALNPAETDELFFVAKGNGSHKFSVTLEEHNAAVKLYQLSKKTHK